MRYCTPRAKITDEWENAVPLIRHLAPACGFVIEDASGKEALRAGDTAQLPDVDMDGWIASV